MLSVDNNDLPAGKVLDLNSTSTALSAAGVYTGTWQDVSAYDSVVVAVKTDVDGSYQVQFSPDGTNADSTLTRYYKSALPEPPHRFTITRRYVRVVYTNGSSDQSYMRLQTLVGQKTPLNVPLDAVASQDYDATMVRPSDYHNEVALGIRQGSSLWNKFGYNNDVDTGTETIWEPGGLFVAPTSAQTLTIVSTSTDDDVGGSGCQSVIVYGVDGNYDFQTEVVELDGTTPVVTSNTWLGVNRVAAYLGANVGRIVATATTDTTVQASIPATEGTTQQCIFFVPRKHTALGRGVLLNVNKLSGASPKVTVVCWVTSLVSNARYNVFQYTIDTAVENHLIFDPIFPFPVGEKSLIEWRATTNTDNTVVNLRFSMEVIRAFDA